IECEVCMKPGDRCNGSMMT
nr:RecName: Full=Phospholipase A2 inhibitor gamma subunit B1; Short=gamma-PLI B1; AltName: Full=Phospholipase A2 inhibitor gamma 20 kDa subunit [Crotalus durissus terrificus]